MNITKNAQRNKNVMETEWALWNGDSYRIKMYLIQYELFSLRNLDSICLLGIVHLEILYLHLNADILFSPGSSWWIFQLNYWYEKTNWKFLHEQ